MKNYSEIRKEIVSLNKQINKLKEQLKDVCDHPKFSRKEYEEDGGIRWKVFSYRCLKCGKWFKFHTKQSDFDEKVNENEYEYFSDGVYESEDWEEWGGI